VKLSVEELIGRLLNLQHAQERGSIVLKVQVEMNFAAELKGSLILGLHIGFQYSFFVLFVHMFITQLVIHRGGLG
jgi:hypothetical protein